VYEKVLSSFAIGSVTLKNRIVFAPHGVGLPWPEPGRTDLVDYLGARARGGAALCFIPWGGVHPSSARLYPSYDSQIKTGYEMIAHKVHEHDAKVLVQLTHRGSQSSNPLGGAPWSASEVPNPRLALTPQSMTQSMIDDLIAGFATSARHARDAGLDGVALQAAHGYLIDEFLSPATNRREDKYGGSRENRTRLLLEIISAIREEVGMDFLLGARVTANEEVLGGIDPVEALNIAQVVEDKLDFLDVSLGSYYRDYKMLAPMDTPLAYQLPQTQQVTTNVAVPTIVAGRIMTLDDAEAVVASGVSELVSMTRALIADPDLITKSASGAANEVRPCIGANMCVGLLMTEGRVGCAVNADAGRETFVALAAPAVRRKKVVVVGAGPAGLEAARSAALSGHDVTVFEMRRHIGGQVAAAAAAPHRSDIAGITNWLGSELKRLGVSLRLRHPVGPDEVLATCPDAVIVATGVLPQDQGFQALRPTVPVPGHDLPHVVTAIDLLGFGRRVDPGDDVLIFDDTGRQDAVSAAEVLMERGSRITFVTPFDCIGANVMYKSGMIAPALERIMTGKFTFLGNALLLEIGHGHVRVGFKGNGETVDVTADTVVYVGHNVPERGLAQELEAMSDSIDIQVIGDANGGSSIRDAIRAARQAVAAIDGAPWRQNVEVHR
jgi:2,4-dienoyl-CoA reductase-like NADH-dependent reductase (Old Yellow Enzyme family)